MESTKAAVIMESKVAPQKGWAEKGGYEAKEGIKQTFTPTHDLKGAIHAGPFRTGQPSNIRHNPPAPTPE